MKLWIGLLAFCLFLMPLVSAAPYWKRTVIWRVGLSRVSTYHTGNTCDWERGTGKNSLVSYTPPCMEPECIGYGEE